MCRYSVVLLYIKEVVRAGHCQPLAGLHSQDTVFCPAAGQNVEEVGHTEVDHLEFNFVPPPQVERGE